MPRTTTKPPTANPPHSTNGTEVLTLSEAAEYLRVSEAEMLRLVKEQSLPGRQISDGWRFLKSALQTWLSTPPPSSSKDALLAMAGKFKDDPFLEKIVEEAYRQRGRPITVKT